MISSPSSFRKRVVGLLFFVVVALFVAWSIGSYEKVFKDVVKIDLLTDATGNSLPPNADVKVRGVIVGEVRSTTTTEGRVTSHLAIDPDKAKLIPSNATARLLPKTLFGERYVSLIVAAGDTAPPIRAGDTLQQDKSGNAIEVGQLLDGLLPLLRAIPPQDLASTLGALSQGLSGRGRELGRTLDRLDQIVGGLNTELPNIQADLRGLADFSETYSDAGPALVDALDNLRTTGATIVEQQDQIRTLAVSLTGTSADTANFLDDNSDSLITIAAGSKQTLQLLAEYSGTFGCTFSKFVPLKTTALGILGLDENGNPKSKYLGPRANALFINPRGRYVPNQDEPRLLDDRGPRCYTSAAPGERFGQYPGGSINDGSYQVPSRNPGPQNIPEVPTPQYSVIPEYSSGDAHTAPAAYQGSTFEQNTLGMIYGQATGADPKHVPGWTTLIGAPAMRGMEVTLE